MTEALFIALHLVVAFPIVVVLIIAVWVSELMIEESKNKAD
tara:strand:+ start:111 stop:233 length:123 start_codon:yes stop_codon:yes gene_type:complete